MIVPPVITFSVSRKSRELFWPKKPVAKVKSACFQKLIFYHVFKVRKTKRIEKFDGLEPRRCEDIKGTETHEVGPKSFGTFEKQAPRFAISWLSCTHSG